MAARRRNRRPSEPVRLPEALVALDLLVVEELSKPFHYFQGVTFRYDGEVYVRFLVRPESPS